eukprot:scaffold93930_cov65-Phaeocystis_antarctica.AAC.1
MAEVTLTLPAAMVSAISTPGQAVFSHTLALKPALNSVCAASLKSETSPAIVIVTVMMVLFTTMLADPGASGEGGGGGGGSAGAATTPDPASPEPESEPEPEPLASSSDLNPTNFSKPASLPTASPCSSAWNNALLEAVCTEVWAVSHVDATRAHDASGVCTVASALNSLDSADAGSFARLIRRNEPGSSEHNGRRSGTSTMTAAVGYCRARESARRRPPDNAVITEYGGRFTQNNGRGEYCNQPSSAFYARTGCRLSD